MNLRCLKILFLIFAGACQFTGSVYAQVKFDNHFKVSRKDFNITLPDKTILDCSSFIPLDTSGRHFKFPCIIYCHGLGKSKYDNMISAESYAEHGFYTFTYSMRGQGNSTSASDFISNDEMNDLFFVVDYLKKDSLINPERIAVIGSSQGGIIPLMAASNGLNVRCIISGLASPYFASDWIQNGCIKMSLLWSLNYDKNILRYKPEIIKFRNWILSGQNDKFDSLKKFFPLNRDFKNKISKIRIPVFLANTWEDKFFSANGNIELYNKINDNSVFLFGFIPGHGSHINLSDSEWAKDKYDDFLQYWLCDSSRIDKIKKYFFSVSEFSESDKFRSYQYYSDISPFDSTMRLKFYFNSSGKIEEFSDSLYKETKGDITLRNIISDTSLSLSKCINEEFTGYDFESKFKKESLTFTTNPLDYNYNIFGIPYIYIYYKSNSKLFQLNFQIFETDLNNQDYFVSSVNYTVRNSTQDKLNKISFRGSAFSHKFMKGNKIKIIITNLDTRKNDSFLRTNPFVLPVLKNYECKIYMNNIKSSYIDFPILEFSVN